MTRFTCLIVLLTACTIEKNLLTDGDDTNSGSTGGTLGASSDGASGTTDVDAGTGSGVTVDETTGAPISSTGGGVATTTDADPSGDDNTGGGIAGAAIERTCAPNDGAALEFRLHRADNTCAAGPGELDLTAVLYQVAPLAPGAYELGAGLGHWELREDGVVTVVSDAGTLIINAWDDDLVSGHFELVLPDDGGSFPGFFELAPFCGGMPTCG